MDEKEEDMSRQSMDEKEEQPIARGWMQAQPSSRNRRDERLEFLIFETQAYRSGTALPYLDLSGEIEANNRVTWFLNTVRHRVLDDTPMYPELGLESPVVDDTPRWPEHIVAGLESGPVSETIRDFLLNRRPRFIAKFDLTEEPKFLGFIDRYACTHGH
jgi:hypothetical protein